MQLTHFLRQACSLKEQINWCHRGLWVVELCAALSEHLSCGNTSNSSSLLPFESSQKYWSQKLEPMALKAQHLDLGSEVCYMLDILQKRSGCSNTPGTARIRFPARFPLASTLLGHSPQRIAVVFSLVSLLGLWTFLDSLANQGSEICVLDAWPDVHGLSRYSDLQEALPKLSRPT